MEENFNWSSRFCDCSYYCYRCNIRLHGATAPTIQASDLEGATETKILDKDGELIYSLGGENEILSLVNKSLNY